ncbi:cell division protein DamX [Vibrio paracholerae]|uniref:Cell division protein DamX n=1 Tax=Vibrio paracholerae TaxID=650003 RepID=A0AAX1QUG4_9VIBR|nr:MULTISPECIES: AAA family ATPase [Vibrio]MBY3672613.1 AAA family ATPase [Vibrio cholerae]RBM57843.1 cell division protein DamX [Vibrio paracholerae]RBM82444.1 cell division protein DamX [Vibrio paracholerae]RNE59510.1 NACHT domain-containing protein [Vibrio cholerae]GHY87658.1 DamX-related protein [Vibrio cholerae]
MSLAHELDLESQTELLERLQLLTRFGSNLVNVCGRQGAGKSWLAQRFLDTWAQDKNQSLLMCHPNQNDEQRRVTMLSQLFSEPLYNPKDALAESFARLFEDQNCDIVIVVDDAHLLSESLVSELWMLVLEAQTNPRWNVNVVLFAQDNGLDALLTRLSYGQEHKPVDLEIEMLSEDEADRLFENRVMRYVDPQVERKVLNAYKKINSLPGEIMALAETKNEKRVVIRSIIGSPFNIALVVLLLLLLLGGGYWWLLSKPVPQEGSLLEGEVAELNSEANPLAQEGTSSANGDGMFGAEGDDFGADDDTSALPPDVVDTTASVGIADDGKRVVINSDVVDALLQGKAETADTSDINNLVESTQAATELKTQTLQQTQVQNAQLKSVSFSFARDELKAMSPRSYTLQLAAMNSLQDVQGFINEHKLQGKVYVYPTLRNDVEWFIVTMGNYPTIQMARDASEKLSASLQALGPWAKSLSQVQREIERKK